MTRYARIAAFSATTMAMLPFAAFAQSPAAPAPSPAVAAAATDPQTLVGTPAPAFSLPDQNDKPVSLADSKGKWVVLAFYPADMTPGCTLQNRSYSADADKFAPLNAVVYTVSTQNTDSKRTFCSKEGLKHTLLSDVGGKTAAAYGVLNGQVARRVTFYIAPDGTIAAVDTKPHVQTAAEDSLAKLQDLSGSTKVTLLSEVVGSFRKTVTGVAFNAEGDPSKLSKVAMNAQVADFSLVDTATGKTVPISSLGAGKKAVAMIFVSTQCPVSNSYNTRMAKLAADYGAKGVAVVGLNANAGESMQDIAAHAKAHGLSFPVLKDAGNQIADRFGAQVTPEVFITDDKGILVYHGPIDDNQGEAQVTTRYAADALDDILAGRPVGKQTARAFGCSIKRVSSQ
jgi:peroxiredoxin